MLQWLVNTSNKSKDWEAKSDIASAESVDELFRDNRLQSPAKNKKVVTTESLTD